MITVYSQPSCQHCVLAKAYLDELEIAYCEVNIRADDEALAFMRGENHRAVPQLYVNGSLLVEGGNQGLRDLSREEIIERVAALLV